MSGTCSPVYACARSDLHAILLELCITKISCHVKHLFSSCVCVCVCTPWSSHHLYYLISWSKQAPEVQSHKITIDVPLVLMAPYVMILRRAVSITRAIIRGGPWNRDFFRPWQREQRVPFEPKKVITKKSQEKENQNWEYLYKNVSFTLLLSRMDINPQHLLMQKCEKIGFCREDVLDWWWC
jgi:hypothetical protein